MEIKFSHKEEPTFLDGIKGVSKYHFELHIEDREYPIYFYTFRDLSGFCLTSEGFMPDEFILLGTAIYKDMKYIKDNSKR